MVGVRIPGQRVVEGRTGHIFDASQRIRRRIAARVDIGGEIDVDPCARRRVIGHVVAGAANQRVIARAAHQRVITGAAVHGIVATSAGKDVRIGIAGQRVIAGRAVQVLDPGQGVGCCVTARPQVGQQADVHRRSRGRIIRRVNAIAADQAVRTRATLQRVIAVVAVQRVVTGTAIQVVGIGIAGDAVGQGRADHILDAHQRVARRVAAGVHVGQKVDRDGCSRGGVGHRVNAGAPVDGVRAAEAGQKVITGLARERVVDGAGCRRESVVACSPVIQRHGVSPLVKARAGALGAEYVHTGLGVGMGENWTHFARRPETLQRNRVIFSIFASQTCGMARLFSYQRLILRRRLARSGP